MGGAARRETEALQVEREVEGQVGRPPIGPKVQDGLAAGMETRGARDALDRIRRTTRDRRIVATRTRRIDDTRRMVSTTERRVRAKPGTHQIANARRTTFVAHGIVLGRQGLVSGGAGLDSGIVRLFFARFICSRGCVGILVKLADAEVAGSELNRGNGTG